MVPDDPNLPESGAEDSIPETAPKTTDEAESLRKIPGAEICSMLGIERDLQMKMLPRGTTVLDVSFGITKNPAAKLQELKDQINRLGGVLLAPLWTEPRTIHLQILFPNLGQASSAAHSIKTTNPLAKIAASENPSGIMTYKGNLVCFGSGFANVNEAAGYARENQDDLVLKDGITMQSAGLNPDTPENIEHFPCHDTPQSRKHANNLQPLNPDLPRKGAMIKVQLPQRTISSDLKNETGDLIRIIDAVHGEKTVISSQGLSALIFIAEERIGEAVARLGSKAIQNLLVQTKASVCIDSADCNFIDAGDGTYLLQSQSVPAVSGMARPGIWGTDGNFTKTIEHERNKANVRVTFGEKSGGVVRIEKIEPIHFEATVGGPRKTIGRDSELAEISKNLENLQKRGRANITVVTGEAGVGKTRLAVEAARRAHELGITNVYYKTPERGKTTPLAGIKKLTEGIFSACPNLIDPFRDLYFWSQGYLPEGFEEEFGPKVRALGSKEFLLKRFLELMDEPRKTHMPMLIGLDDLHWLDDVSRDIIKIWLSKLDASSNINVALIAREGEETLPQDLGNVVKSKSSISSEIKLKRLDYKQNPELLKEYIKNYFPETWESAEIPDKFATEIAEISEGLPLVITEILSLLLEKGDIRYQQGLIVIRENAVQELQKADLGATLSAVLQSRFERLSTDEKRVVDYFVALGDISDINIFTNLLRYLGEDPACVTTALDVLKQKGIVRFNPFGFTHDLLRSQREKQMEGHEGNLSKVAAMCYPVLERVKARYPKVITPVFLFELSGRALKRPDVLEETQKRSLVSAFTKNGDEACEYCLRRNENMAIASITERLLEKVEPAAERVFESNDENAKISWAVYLYKVYCQVAEAFIRMGLPNKAKECLKKIDDTRSKVPNAQLLAGVSGLQYYILAAKTAYAAQNMQGVIMANGQLKTAITLTQSPQDKAVILAQGESWLMEVRTERDMQRVCEIIVPSAKRALSKLGKDARQRGDFQLVTQVRALETDITRTVVQRQFVSLSKKLQGLDSETLFMQQGIKGESLEQLGNQDTTLSAILKDYQQNPDLVRDPQAYGYLFDTLARIRFLKGADGRAYEIKDQGLDTCSNMDLFEVVGRLRKLTGDVKTAHAIRTNPTDPKTWNQDELQSAIENYTKAMAESGQLDPNALYVTLNALNRGFATALLALAKTPDRFERFEETDELTELGTRLREEWTSMCNALGKIKTHVATGTGVFSEQDYRKELAALGLLLEASRDPRLNVTLQMPPDIDLDDIRSETEFLENQTKDAKAKPGNYSAADKGMLALRMRGTNAWKSVFTQLGATYELGS